MKHIQAIAVLLALTLWAGHVQSKEVYVVADLPTFAVVAEELGGGRVKAEALGRPEVDPHFQAPLPSYAIKLNRADLLIENGLELTIGWMPALLDQSRNRDIARGGEGRVLASEGVGVLNVPTEKVSRLKGDVHPSGDPHYTCDPHNCLPVAQNIAAGLARVDPEGSSQYRDNLQQFQSDWSAKLKDWDARMAPWRGARVVSYHRYWDYLEHAYGLEDMGTVEPKPGIPPSGKDILQLANRMKAEGCRVILVNCWDPKKAIQLLAERTGAVVVELCGQVGAVAGTDSLRAMHEHNVNALIKGFKEAGYEPRSDS